MTYSLTVVTTEKTLLKAGVVNGGILQTVQQPLLADVRYNYTYAVYTDSP